MADSRMFSSSRFPSRCRRRIRMAGDADLDLATSTIETTVNDVNDGQLVLSLRQRLPVLVLGAVGGGIGRSCGSCRCYG